MTTLVPREPQQRPGAGPHRVTSRLGRTARYLAPFIIALTVYLASFAIMQPAATGDEQYYMVFALSLAQDHDIDLSNNYADGGWRFFYTGASLSGHARDFHQNGELVSWHGIGLPMLIAPLFLVQRSLLLVRLEMILFAALLAHEVFYLMRDLKVASSLLVWLVWVSVVLTGPVLMYSNQVYTEIPAALLLVFALRRVFRPDPTKGALWLTASAMAILPWLHFRFAVFSVGFGLLLAYQAWRSNKGASGFASAIVIPLSLGGMLLAFSIWYGNASPLVLLDPSTPNQMPTGTIAQPRFDVLYAAALGQWLSPSYGWLPFAPVHWFGLIGLMVFAARRRLVALWALCTIGAYVMLVSILPAGGCFPARYLVPIIPLIGVPMLVILERFRKTRIVFVLALAYSLAIGGSAVLDYQSLYPVSPRTYLSTLRLVPPVWPEFSFLPDHLILSGSSLPRTTGRIADYETDATGTVSKAAEAVPESDPPGFIAYGPWVALADGRYVATFTLSSQGASGQKPVAVVDINVNRQHIVLARKEILAGDLGPDGKVVVSVPFTTQGDYAIETRVYYTGNALVRMHSIEVQRNPPLPVVDERFPSLWKSVAWVLVTASAMVALWLLDRRRDLFLWFRISQ